MPNRADNFAAELSKRAEAMSSSGNLTVYLTPDHLKRLARQNVRRDQRSTSSNCIRTPHQLRCDFTLSLELSGLFFDLDLLRDYVGSQTLTYAVPRVKELLLTLLYLAVMTAKLCAPGGVGAVIAENLLL